MATLTQSHQPGDEHVSALHEDESVDEARQPPQIWCNMKSVWENNKGALMILVSQVFGSSMDAIARFLQQQGTGYHAFQIVLFRMGITLVLSVLYMWWIQVPYFPLGNPTVRSWLILRALFGFFGLVCLYYSVHYLPLAEATVLRFLVPLVTAWACHVFLAQPFTTTQLTAGLIALLGVLLIANPTTLFHPQQQEQQPSSPDFDDLDPVPPSQRLLAILISLLGVFGASAAYTTIRIIGARAHALVSVTYFALLATLGSALFLAATDTWTTPRSARDWALLCAMGALGFALQFLLTTGLALDKSPRATSMMYTQVLFALAFDWGVWGVLPGMWSWVGGAVVVASTLWSALQSGGGRREKERVGDEEERPLLGEQREQRESS